MNGVMERLTGFPSLPELFGWAERGFPGMHLAPGLRGIRVEEYLRVGLYVLRAELPGLDPAKDVGITMGDNVLTLRAERSEETKEKHRTEFRYGSFARSVRLPTGAKGEETTAEHKDGVLTITVPVPEEKAGTDHPGAVRLR
ncbi:Hsp20/alpha crystallin family protein [Streptomyces sp. NPDC005251]|uniref:Hsp20/alpha crystallin family protein n=1 Tax=Streptomyces sp. NPDC005251 TaxID=3157166 RepID=UPI0033ADAC11